ncbi:MAG TPA: DUF4384 domain-containing protein [Pyrinomonadaceae bacterium]|nr:DUF4384 domain-containing protein [Pyrinomonadaceae bacterium]
MRFKLFSQLLLATLVVVFPARAQQEGQQPPQDEETTTRGAFLTTRPKASNREGARVSGGVGVAVTTPEKASAPAVAAANASPGNSKKSVVKSPGKAAAKKNDGKGMRAVKADTAAADVKTPGHAETGVAAVAPAAANGRPIGLGYTFFTLGDNGLAVRTDSARQFRTGEAIRIALEANTDGYLYIFHTENDGEPSMIFPDMRLNGGNNLVRAHVPYEIPSSEEATEEMRWFVFKDPPAVERLYIVLSRQPLAGVPTGATLAGYCFDARHTCPWRPAAAVWTELKSAQEREQVAVSKVKDQGRAQTADERVATTRGLGLAAGAPTPSVIRMTASPNSKMLVTAIDLIHK